MDFVMDLFEFMLIKAQKTGFENQAQEQRCHYLCGKMLQLYPQVREYAQAQAPAPQQYQPYAPPAPAPAPAPAWGAPAPAPAQTWGAPAQLPFKPQTPAPVGWGGL